MKLNKIFLFFIFTSLLFKESESTQMKSETKMETATQFGPKRYTEDGQVCARTFVQNGVVFDDCTTIKSPDGKDTKKEWCYLANPKKGAPNWAYCKENLNYNVVRKSVQENYAKISETVKVNINKSNNVIRPANDFIRQISTLKEQQRSIQTLSLAEDLKSMATMNNHLNALKKQWTDLEEQCVEIQGLINAKEAELELEKKSEEENQNDLGEIGDPGKEYAVKTRELIQEETDMYSMAINPLISDKILTKDTTPKNIPDFEDDQAGNGLVAFYYDNSKFAGVPLTELVSSVDFDLTGRAPLEEINKDAFSIIYKGYIIPPITSKYIFMMDTDDKDIIISINGGNIRNYPQKKKLSLFQKVVKFVVKIFTHADYLRESKNTLIESKQINLIGGSKYRIELRYKHNTHSSAMSDRSFLKLTWRCSAFNQCPVEQEYTYTEYPKENFKIFINPDKGTAKKLFQNDLAFKDSEDFILQDIPAQYFGMPSIKLFINQKNEYLTFETTTPAIMYVGLVDKGYVLPPNGFQETGDTISLLQLESGIYDYTNINKKYQRKMYSKDSWPMKLYQYKLRPGKQNIKFTYTINDIVSLVNDKKKSRLLGLAGIVVFFGFDSSSNIHRSCGVDGRLISEPSSDDFESCSASTQKSPCKDGFTLTQENKKWIADHEGIGAWIQINFKGEYEVSKIDYNYLSNPNQKGTVFTATFSTGETKELSLGNTVIQSWQINPPIITEYIKFSIKTTKGQINNGGRFAVYGGKCVSETDEDELPEDMNKLFGGKDDEDNVISLGCTDSFDKTFRSYALDGIKLKVGKKLKIHCVESCKESSYKIYGLGTYASISAICKAAYHSGALNTDGGIFELIMNKGLNSYSSATQYGISSDSYGPTPISFQFRKSSNYEINEDPDRDPSKLNANKKKGKEPQILRIKFVPKGFKASNLNGILLDEGQIFGYNKNPFGWAENMERNMKKTEGLKNIIGDTSVVMNPDKKSLWCASTDCDRNPWKIHVGPGRYKVKVYIHDVLQNYLVNLQINGFKLVENTLVKKNCLAEFEGEFGSDEKGYLTLTDECKENCNYAQAKLNFIEIKKVEDESTEKQEEANKPAVAGVELIDKNDAAYYKGRCDTGDRVENCVYDSVRSEGAKFCRDPFKLVTVSNSYPSSFQRGKIKCIKKNYYTDEECLKYCPGNCQNKICNA
ncbi:MAG: PA14 domain-containing protein [archaeon]|nr:PA14 domain-containing protein [archaeon]